MLENSLSVPRGDKGFIEETIILKETKNLLKYTLSNSLDTIRMAISSRTGHNIDLKEAIWTLNPGLSVSVKHLMNSHNANFSMTTDIKDEVKFIVINMRVGDNWFITGYDEIDNKLFNWEFMSISIEAVIFTINMLIGDDTNNDI